MNEVIYVRKLITSQNITLLVSKLMVTTAYIFRRSWRRNSLWSIRLCMRVLSQSTTWVYLDGDSSSVFHDESPEVTQRFIHHATDVNPVR